jgi:hypothetical protein
VTAVLRVCHSGLPLKRREPLAERIDAGILLLEIESVIIRLDGRLPPRMLRFRF